MGVVHCKHCMQLYKERSILDLRRQGFLAGAEMVSSRLLAPALKAHGRLRRFRLKMPDEREDDGRALMHGDSFITSYQPLPQGTPTAANHRGGFTGDMPEGRSEVASFYPSLHKLFPS